MLWGGLAGFLFLVLRHSGSLWVVDQSAVERSNLFDGLDDDAETRRLLACAIAAEMCAKLEERGFKDFHFYTLNRADLVYAICRVLGVRETA